MSVVAPSAGWPASLKPRKYWVSRLPGVGKWVAAESPYPFLKLRIPYICISACTENLAIEQAICDFGIAEEENN